MSPPRRLRATSARRPYVYSKATFLHHYRQIRDAFAAVHPTICYSIKSCGNINILKFLREEGCGFDVTSGGELFRALQAGADPKKIIYAGVGKSDQEIADAINVGIAAFNLESEAEIENVDRIAGEIGKQAIGALRINPDVDPRTHAKTTTGKKGNQVRRRYRARRAGFRAVSEPEKPEDRGRSHSHWVAGVRHQPYIDAVTKMNELIDRLTERGHTIEWFDMGGGFGVNYQTP
jgi:diaminopimelate decarboxylase